MEITNIDLDINNNFEVKKKPIVVFFIIKIGRNEEQRECFQAFLLTKRNSLGLGPFAKVVRETVNILFGQMRH